MKMLNRFIDPVPMSARRVALCNAIEDDLAQGIAPLGHQFLCDNEVTLDEAYDLADLIRAALVVYRNAPFGVVGEALAQGALSS